MIAVFIFILTALMLGHSVMRFVEKRSLIQYLSLSFLTGIGVLAVLTHLMQLIRIPLHAELVLLISLVFPVYDAVSRKIPFKLEFTRMDVFVIVAFILVLVLFSMLFAGSTRYPWLESSDPWDHAAGVSYVEQTASYHKPDSMYLAHYLPPYPPAYGVVVGMYAKYAPDPIVHIKFFNALFVALAVVASFFLFRALSNDLVAIAGAFVLFSLPGSTHFIFAQQLALLYAITGLYFGVKYFENARYIIPFVILSVAVALTQQIVSVYYVFSAMLLFGIFILFDKDRIVEHIKRLIIPAGITVLLVASFFIPQFIIYGQEGVFETYTLIEEGAQDRTWYYTIHIPEKRCAADQVGQDGCVHPYYSFSDFFTTSGTNSIDVGKGFGQAATILAIIGLMFVIAQAVMRKDKVSFFIAAWAVMGVLGILADAFPVAFLPHRWWALAAFGVALCAAFGAYAIGQGIVKLSGWKPAVWLVIIMLMIPVYATSYVPKADLNTRFWPPHEQVIAAEFTGYFQAGVVDGYLSLYGREKRSRMTDLCGSHQLVAGLGMSPPISAPMLRAYLNDARPLYYGWDVKDADGAPYTLSIEKVDPDRVAGYMERNDVDELIVGTTCVFALESRNDEAVNAFFESTLNRFVAHPRFELSERYGNVFIFSFR